MYLHVVFPVIQLVLQGGKLLHSQTAQPCPFGRAVYILASVIGFNSAHTKIYNRAALTRVLVCSLYLMRVFLCRIRVYSKTIFYQHRHCGLDPG